MTETEKQMQRDLRDDAIVKYYLEGHRVRDCSSKFRLSRQRVHQILNLRGVWKPMTKGERIKHLGVTVTPETKDALKELADAKEMSVSQLVSDHLEELIDEHKQEQALGREPEGQQP